MTRIAVILLLSALIFGCEKPHKTYVINCCTDFTDDNNLLNLAENANYQSLQYLKDTSALVKYLKPDEFKTAFDTLVEITENDTTISYKTEYAAFDTIFTSHHFLAQLFLVKDNTQGRGYYFQIRTFDEEHHLVSAQDFAIWSDRDKKYCSGHLSKIDHSFTIKCEHHEVHYEFDPHGKISRSEWQAH